MTVTISRLYDNYTDAQQAVRRLETAGVPHSDISIVANNSDSWFNTDKRVDRDRDGVDDRAEGAGAGAGIGAGVIASVPLAVGISALEIIVVLVQAYVFTLLTAVFIGMAIHVHH